MALTATLLRYDKRCGQSGIPDNRKCTKTPSAPLSTPPTEHGGSPNTRLLLTGAGVAAMGAVLGVLAHDVYSSGVPKSKIPPDEPPEGLYDSFKPGDLIYQTNKFAGAHRAHYAVYIGKVNGTHQVFDTSIKQQGKQIKSQMAVRSIEAATDTGTSYALATRADGGKNKQPTREQLLTIVERLNNKSFDWTGFESNCETLARAVVNDLPVSTQTEHVSTLSKRLTTGIVSALAPPQYRRNAVKQKNVQNLVKRTLVDSAELRIDKRCGKSGIADNKNCTRTIVAGTNRTKPAQPSSISNNLRLVLGAVAAGTISVAGLRAVDDVVRTRSRQYGEPTFTTFNKPFGNAEKYINAPDKKPIAAGAFGKTSFVTVEGTQYVVKEPQSPSKATRKAMAVGLTAKAVRNLYRAQGRITQSEVANARLAGDIGVAPRVVAASRGALVTEVARGTPTKEFNSSTKHKLYATLAKLHRAGIAHNDLKGDNIFTDKASGTLELIDFGLSQRNSGAVAREWYRAMNPESPNVLLAVTGTTTGSFNLRTLNPSGYKKAESALARVLKDKVSEENLIKASKDARTARQIQIVINNFYEGKYNEKTHVTPVRGHALWDYSSDGQVQSPVRNLVKDRAPLMKRDAEEMDKRLDKKCGASGIPDSAKCTKGGNWPRAATIGAALTAGGIAAYALTRGGGKSVATDPSAPESGPPRLPGLTPRALLAQAPARLSKTQRLRANTAEAIRTAEGRIAQTAREEVRRVAQIGNTMAAAGEATGMAAKTTLRELRLRTEAARRRFEPGYRSAPAAKPKTPAQLSPGMEPAFEVPLNPPRRRSPEAASVDPRTGQPRRRRARGFGRRDSGVVFYGSQVINPARRDTDDGKKYTKVVTNPETGRKNRIRYGAKGYKIAPGTNKGDNYCARSFGDMKSEGYDCSGAERNTPLCLSRAKWKCSGKTSRRGDAALTPGKSLA